VELGLDMGANTAIDRMRRELHGVLDHMLVDLDRIEILLGALNGFSQPIPDYEPGFHHLRQATRLAHELGSHAGGEP
jgi:hypothetical protein